MKVHLLLLIGLLSILHPSSQESFHGEFIADPNSLSRPDQVRTTHIHLDLDIDFTRTILTGYVIISLKKSRPDINSTILDAKDLVIYNIQDVASSKDIPYQYFKDEDKLEVSLSPGEDVQLKIHYSTTPRASALSWLSPDQTGDKEHPFMFSLCETIHCRSMLPCQDTPSVKFPYSADITSPPQFTVLMSAIGKGEAEILGNGKRRFSFDQKVPVQSYLIAIAAGAVERRKIGPRSHIWSEKKFMEKAVFDFSETESMLLEAEKLSGPYVWGVYDILIMPPSFPYGGMENPCLTYASTSLLSGDKSNAYVIAHEIAHSWTGNLVTNINFEHFWLNEGFTTFVEQKISGRLFGKSARHLNALVGWTNLKNTVEKLGPNDPFTALVVNLTGIHPDQSISHIPFQKGSVFLWYLESLVGANNMENFLRSYYQWFKYQSVSSETFKKHFIFYFSSHPALPEIDWNAWLYSPGMPIYKPPFDTSYAEESWDLAEIWQQWDTEGPAPVVNANHLQDFSARQTVLFLDKLLLGEPLDVKTLEKMEEDYNLNENGNVEIYHLWIRLGLKARWEESVEEALKLLSEVGRLQFTSAVYADLYGWKEKRELAVQTFRKNEDKMMSVSRGYIRKILHLENLEDRR